MVALPTEIILIVGVFAQCFSKPSFENAKLLLTGSLLCTGSRRISTLLSIVGLGHSSTFCNYHRFLNRARYNGCNLAKIMLGLLLYSYCLLMIPSSWLSMIL